VGKDGIATTPRRWHPIGMAGPGTSSTMASPGYASGDVLANAPGRGTRTCRRTSRWYAPRTTPSSPGWAHDARPPWGWRAPFGALSPDRKALSTTNVPKTTLAAPKRAYAPASPYLSLQGVPCCQRHADDRNGRLKDRRRGASAPTSLEWTSCSPSRLTTGPRSSLRKPRTREHGGHECPGHHGDPEQNE